MSIATEITRITNAKAALKASINAKTDSSHKIANETIDEYADFVDTIQQGASDRFKATLQALTERKCSYFKDFSYDNERYAVIDLSVLDGTDFEIEDIGARTLNSFENSYESGTQRKIRIIMPKNLSSVSGSNWAAGVQGKYYDFSGYQGNTPPIYTSNMTTFGNNSARILVPAALETAWKAATGWTAFSSQIIGVSEVYS